MSEPLAVQASQEDNEMPDLSEQGSPSSKALKIDRPQLNEYQMHSTPLHSKLLSIPAPVLTPIAMQEKVTQDNQEKADPQPSTSEAKPERSHLRRQLASKQMKVNIIENLYLFYHIQFDMVVSYEVKYSEFHGNDEMLREKEGGGMGGGKRTSKWSFPLFLLLPRQYKHVYLYESSKA